ncbi:MAG: tRNA ((37)-N6)-threonylcarbamoyltransferase complex ATPase subunit type 1 TsaE [Betaproteobacteria bacterium]|nr:tRNA ((37)-N6)-threonylcarbamoyltransferase complex ATPase subunit type 1 TsaE [Betaproteobacteria bacterium]
MKITRRLITEADTAAFGAELAVGLQPGMVVYLKGELGAGKTTLARGLLQALGVTERIKSPTYTLVEPYTVSSLYLYHFDFYRLRYPDEWVDAGFREYFNRDAVCLIEWPENAGGKLPAADVAVELKVDGEGRALSLHANTEAGTNCLRRLKT